MWINRRMGGGRNIKSMVKWRDILHWFKLPVASFTIEADTHFFLNPTIRNQDFSVESQNGFDLQKWFYAHGRGKLYMSYTPSVTWVDPYRTFVTIWFTDKDTAMRAKLTWGGR